MAKHQGWRVACAMCAGLGLGCPAVITSYPEPDGPRYEGRFSDGVDADPTRLEIGTFNVEFGVRYAEAAADLLADPATARLDVLFLQEMGPVGTASMARALALDYVFYPGNVHTDGRDLGNAVLSKWPIVSDRKLVLPYRNPTNGRVRLAVGAELNTPHGPLTVYSVHSDTPWLGPRARMAQAQAVVDAVEGIDHPVVLGGDYNTSDPGSGDRVVEIHADGDLAWMTPNVENTATAVIGRFTLDYVFARGLERIDSGLVDSEASDHRPVWTHLTWPP